MIAERGYVVIRVDQEGKTQYYCGDRNNGYFVEVLRLSSIYASKHEADLAHDAAEFDVDCEAGCRYEVKMVRFTLTKADPQ